MQTLGVVNTAVDALCARSKKLGSCNPRLGVAELERRRFSKNAAYISALEQLRPLVSLV